MTIYTVMAAFCTVRLRARIEGALKCEYALSNQQVRKYYIDNKIKKEILGLEEFIIYFK